MTGLDVGEGGFEDDADGGYDNNAPLHDDIEEEIEPDEPADPNHVCKYSQILTTIE